MAIYEGLAKDTDPIYKNGSFLVTGNRLKRFTKNTPETGEQEPTPNPSSPIDQKPSKELPDPVDELFVWVASQEELVSENSNPTQLRSKQSTTNDNKS